LGAGTERLFYEGPLAQVLQSELSAAARLNPSSDETAASDYDCPECRDLGWCIFNASPEEDYLGEVQACDCGFFTSDDEAVAAARAAGLSVDDSHEVLFSP
jgi:hypothetical protein